MPHRRPHALAVLSTLALVLGLALPAVCQTVISARSGLIHYFEGSVYVDNQPLDSQPGRYISMNEGAELRTAKGSAEVLLTPGVFLRVGEGSAVRLVACDLADTQAELLAGSAIVESDEPSPGTSVTLLYKHWKVRFLERGTYRIDSEPARLWVAQGRAEVSGEAIVATPVLVERGMDLPFAAVLVPEQSLQQPADQLSEWSKGRSQSISADNRISSQISDPGTMDALNLPPDAFTYYPLVGPSGMAPPLYSQNSSYYPYQPGFYSVYLPGYAYAPLVLALPMRGYRSIVPYSTIPRAGTIPGIGSLSSTGIMLPHPGSMVPHAPSARPLPTVRPIPHTGGIRGIGVAGGHR